jgi:acyl-CoA thioesterase FadM
VIVSEMSHGDRLPDPATIVVRRRIDWMDTDAAGIYHYTTAFRLAEAAEAAMHTALGIADRTFGATPRLAVQVEFRRALRFNDEVEVTLTVTALGRTSIRYALTLTCAAGIAAEGELIACLVDRDTRRATEWPEDIRERLASGGRLDAGLG